MIEKLKAIIETRDYKKMVGFSNYPQPGEYYITGPIAGPQGNDLARMVGYIVQVRLKAGAFGSDIVLMRCPDGVLARHENQFFFAVNEEQKQKIIDLFEDKTKEDYSSPYTLGGEYPETGKVIQPKENGPLVDNSPLMKITTKYPDGSKTVEIC